MRRNSPRSKRPPMFPLMPFVPLGLLAAAAVGTVAVWRPRGTEARLDAMGMDGAGSMDRG